MDNHFLFNKIQYKHLACFRFLPIQDNTGINNCILKPNIYLCINILRKINSKKQKVVLIKGLFVFKIFIYLFIFRQRVREKERETSICGYLSSKPLLGTWSATQAGAMIGN